MDKTFFERYGSQAKNFKLSSIFIHDNAPSHSVEMTIDYPAGKCFKDPKWIESPPASPNYYPVENPLPTIKRDIYVNGKQYSRDDLWKAKNVAVNKPWTHT